jgi:hypothetical protein
MTAANRPSFTKRQKELKRAEKRAKKEEKRQARKDDKGDRTDLPEGVDPDIADIVPGPQPTAEWDE